MQNAVFLTFFGNYDIIILIKNSYCFCVYRRYIMLFEKKQKPYVDLIDFSRHNVATGMVSAYIQKVLYEIEGFSEIGYRYENSPKKGERFVLYTHPENSKRVFQYFKDRNSGMIEKEVMLYKDKQLPCSWKKWRNGHEYVIPYKG